LTGVIRTEEVTHVSECDSETQRDGFFFDVERNPGGVTVIRVTGDLNGDTHSRLYRLVADELARDPIELVLELSGATDVDGVGVEAMVGASALAAELDTSFCLIAPPNGPVARALGAAGLIERFEIFATLGDAYGQR
jgi:anti-anti-sigma factor